jgi:hypothetical protein
MPRLELEQSIKRVIIVVVSKFKTPQPKSWLARFGLNRTG